MSDPAGARRAGARFALRRRRRRRRPRRRRRRRQDRFPRPHRRRGSRSTDLKAEEITLKVNGKPRQIQSLGPVHSAAAAASSSSGGSALPPPYATNAVGKNGRVIHVLIDDDSITPGREGQVKEAVRLLPSELAPGESLGVLTPQGQLEHPPVGGPHAQSDSRSTASPAAAARVKPRPTRSAARRACWRRRVDARPWPAGRRRRSSSSPAGIAPPLRRPST